jgi:hypothetical protein
MKATIEIDMGNEAFADNQGCELALILRRLAYKIDYVGSFCCDDETPLFDGNGNRVGQMLTHED